MVPQLGYLLSMEKPIRSYCRANGITLKQFAAGVGRSLSVVKKWESCRRVPLSAMPDIVRFTEGRLSGRIFYPEFFAATDTASKPNPNISEC